MADLWKPPIPKAEVVTCGSQTWSNMSTYTIKAQEFDTAIHAILRMVSVDAFAIRFDDGTAMLSEAITFSKKSNVVLLGHTAGAKAGFSCAAIRHVCHVAILGTTINLNKRSIHVEGSNFCAQDLLLTNGEVPSASINPAFMS